MNLVKHQVIYWFPVYIYMIIIFYFSSLPNVFVYMPQVIKPFFMSISDIIYHILEYMVLGFLLYRALLKSEFKNAIALAIIIAILYGFIDEIHQLFVPSRIFSLLDVLSNSFGAIVVQSIIDIKNGLCLKKISL